MLVIHSPHALPVRAVAAVLVLAASPLASASAAPVATAAAPDGLVNGDAERATLGFEASEGAFLTNSTRAHGGRASLKLITPTAQPSYVDATTVPDRAGTTEGATSVARAWVRTSRAGQPVQLVLRETADGETVRSVDTVTPAPGVWTPVEVRSTATRTGATLSVRVAAPEADGPMILRIDDLTLTDAGDDTPPNAPPPTPAPPTTPAPPPAGGGTLTNGCAYSPRGLPACGAYLGASHGGNTVPTALEGDVGRRLGVRRTFYGPTQVAAAVRTATEDVEAGRLPWISFKLPDAWDDMAAGSGDAWARDIAARMSDVPGPVWLAFHHEPEGDGDIAAWRALQERLAPLVRAAAPNVAYTVILTGWNQFYGDSRYNLANVWPRGVKIDVAGFDLYNEYGVTKNGRLDLTWPDLDAEYFARIQAWAADQGVAWGVAETAYTDAASLLRPDWISTTYDELVARDGVAMAYFDTTLNAFGSWQLATPAKRRGLADALRGTAALPLP